jgi:hypothetical protein
MMKERGNNTDAETFTIDLAQEIYLRGREEPMRINSTFEIRKETLTEGHEIEDLMSIATTHLLATIDVVREHRYILSDRRFNKFISLTDEIQAVSILAPDEDTLFQALEA